MKMKKKIFVRTFTDSEINESTNIKNFIKYVEEEKFSDFYGHFDLASLSERPIDFIFLISKNNSLDKDKMIGFLRGHIMWDWMKIETLWVASNYRKRGLATRLLIRAKALALSKDIYSIYLTTWNKDLLTFYTRQGFNLVNEFINHPTGFSMYTCVLNLSNLKKSTKSQVKKYST